MLQLDTSRFREFGVQGQYLDGESNFVHDSLAGAVAAGEKLKVLQPVMLPISVDVVDCLFGEQITSEVFGHDVAMFHDGMAFAGHERWNRNPDVSIALDVSPKITAIEFFKRFLALVFSFARSIAKFLLGVNAPARFTATTLFFAALNAGKALAFHGVFSPTNSRTSNRAVGRVFSEFLSMRSEIRRFVREGFVAFSASQPYQRLLSGRTPVDCFVSSKAFDVAKLASSVLRFDSKWLAAVFASFVDRHVYSPLLGRQEFMTRVAS